MSYEFDLISNTKSNCIFPESCISFQDQTQYINNYIEEEYINFISKLANDELIYFKENGALVVYEGAKLDDLKDSIEQFFENIWSTIKSQYEDIYCKFERDLREFKNRKIKDIDISKLDDTKVYGNTFEYFNMKDYDFGERARKFADKINEEFKSIDDETESKCTKESLMSDVYKAVSSVDANSLVKMEVLLKRKLKGDKIKVDKKYFEKNYDDMLAIAQGNAVEIAIKKAYNDEKKYFTNMIRSVQKTNDSYASFIEDWLRCLDTTMIAMVNCYAIAMDMYRRRYKEYRVILTRISSLQ